MQKSELTFGPRIKRISNAMERKRTADLEDMELTSSQGLIIGYLSRRQGEAVYPGDIGKHFGLSHPTVTGLLQRLEAKGFLTYEADGVDRRKKRLCLTEKAVECHQRIQGCFLEMEARLTRGMTEAEQTQFKELLDRVIDNMGIGCACCGSQSPKEERK